MEVTYSTHQELFEQFQAIKYVSTCYLFVKTREGKECTSAELLTDKRRNVYISSTEHIKKRISSIT